MGVTIGVTRKNHIVNNEQKQEDRASMWERPYLQDHVVNTARVAEQVDATDLKSVSWQRLCRFESGLGHHSVERTLPAAP